MLLEDPAKRSDPRDNLQKRRRFELWNFAKRHGINEISEDMPARLMRKRLRARGIQDLDMPLAEPVLGGRRGQASPASLEPNIAQVKADDELERHWAAQREEKPEIPSFAGLKGPRLRNAMRQECKRRGIPTRRTDTVPDLKERLGGQDPS